MVGFYARADSTKPIRTDLDNELVGKYSLYHYTHATFSSKRNMLDARWFTRDEVRSVLEHRAGTKFDKSDYAKLNEVTQGTLGQNAEKDLAMQTLTPAEFKTAPKEPSHSEQLPFRLPPATAIAGVLIRDWVSGKIGFPQDVDKGEAIYKHNL